MSVCRLTAILGTCRDFVYHRARESQQRYNLAGDCQTHPLHSGLFRYLLEDFVDPIGYFLGIVLPPENTQNPSGLRSTAASVVRNSQVRPSRR